MLKINNAMLKRFTQRGPGYASVRDSADLMPDWNNIPLEFKLGQTKWNILVDDWYNRGLSRLDVKPRNGVNKDAAIRCIIAHMKAWKVSDEHRQAGVAYMMASLFEDATWEVMKNE